jgi:hypothetical protein
MLGTLTGKKLIDCKGNGGKAEEGQERGRKLYMESCRDGGEL